MAKYTFSRNEIKFILTPEQFKNIEGEIKANVRQDDYGESNILSLYYDTENFRLIRESIEKPKFKEKIRVRSYGNAKEGSQVFLEIKRKAKGVVYKRRISLTENEASGFLSGKNELKNGQIENELTYFKTFYGKLIPSFLVIYTRTAYCDNEKELRITFDKNIKFRRENMNLHSGFSGEIILPDGYILMEVKTKGAMPTWLIQLLSREKIYKTSFSKCGEAYKIYIQNTYAKEKKIG